MRSSLHERDVEIRHTSAIPSVEKLRYAPGLIGPCRDLKDQVG